MHTSLDSCLASISDRLKRECEGQMHLTNILVLPLSCGEAAAERQKMDDVRGKCPSHSLFKPALTQQYQDWLPTADEEWRSDLPTAAVSRPRMCHRHRPVRSVRPPGEPG
jgi:hypothetical protein